MAVVLKNLGRQYGTDTNDDVWARLRAFFEHADDQVIQRLTETAAMDDAETAVSNLLELIEEVEDERIVPRRMAENNPTRTPQELFEALNKRPNSDDDFA